jgi:hypothetical protein
LGAALDELGQASHVCVETYSCKPLKSEFELKPKGKRETRNAKLECTSSESEEDQTGLWNAKIRDGKKIAARKGGGKGELSLILRSKEHHGGDNSVNS